MTYLWLNRYAPYPPLHAGNVTYTSHLIENLAAFAPVDVLCYRAFDGDFPQTEGVTWHLLPRRGQPRWRSVVSRLPNVTAQHRRDSFVAPMLELADKADVVIIDHLGMAWCAELLNRHRKARGGGKRPVLLFIPHDHNKSVRRFVAAQIGNPLMRLAVGWDAIKASWLEASTIEACDGVIVLTTRDRELFMPDHPNKAYVLVEPGYSGGSVAARHIGPDVAERICVLGGRGAFHKRLVLQQCLDAMGRAGPPAAEVDIVGDIDDKMRSELQARYPGLTFRGFIEDIDAYLATVRLGILPDAVGGGFKLRALTYAFNRVPMLAVRGALAGMGLTPGVEYEECDDLDSMVATARTLVQDFERLNQLQEAAFRHCQGRFEWRGRAADLHKFASCLVDKAAASG